MVERAGTDGQQGRERHQGNGDAQQRAEQEEAEDRSAPTPSVVWQAIYSEGRDELGRQPRQLAWSAVAAGLSMGFSLITEGLLRRYVPETAWQPLVTKLGYAMGFLIVVLGRQQLFTENTLTVVLPLLHRKNGRALKQVLRLWTVVLVGNLVGAVTIAWVVAKTGTFDEPTKTAFTQVAMGGTGASFGLVVLRGIFAGWLIALMVWLMPGAETARIWIIILITYVIALGGFAHVIAGSVDKLYLVWTGQLSLGGYLGGFFVPSWLGNMIGGISLVAALNHVAAAPSHPPD
ncbi:MAG TPA: formate/nitrite transporter family protein [Myxococcales bacterium]|jgi:formate/nitrite transporter FocA (FNT family)|nr:formate/nitrite transporter family protein [Myxococcales bacterium]